MNAQHTTETRALEAYALENYESGGHWVYETHDAADYLEALTDAGGDIDKARAELRRYWELQQQMCDEVRAEAF